MRKVTILCALCKLQCTTKRVCCNLQIHINKQKFFNLWINNENYTYIVNLGMSIMHINIVKNINFLKIIHNHHILMKSKLYFAQNRHKTIRLVTCNQFLSKNTLSISQNCQYLQKTSSTKPPFGHAALAPRRCFRTQSDKAPTNQSPPHRAAAPREFCDPGLIFDVLAIARTCSVQQTRGVVKTRRSAQLLDSPVLPNRKTPNWCKRE